MPEIDDQLAHYLAVRDRQRDDRVNRVVGSLSERERALVREAAVMGYVLGTQGATPSAEIPKDRVIVWRVIDACLAHSDLYPVISGRKDANEETDADE